MQDQNKEVYQILLTAVANLRCRLTTSDIDRETKLDGLKDLSNLELKLVAAMTAEPEKPKTRY